MNDAEKIKLLEGEKRRRILEINELQADLDKIFEECLLHCSYCESDLHLKNIMSSAAKCDVCGSDITYDTCKGIIPDISMINEKKAALEKEKLLLKTINTQLAKLKRPKKVTISSRPKELKENKPVNSSSGKKNKRNNDVKSFFSYFGYLLICVVLILIIYFQPLNFFAQRIDATLESKWNYFYTNRYEILCEVDNLINNYMDSLFE